MLDGAAQARGGLAAISGPADGPPMPPGAAIADHTGAMQLALGVMTALYARERTGRGQEVDDVVAGRADVGPGLGDHAHDDGRRAAAAGGPAQPEHPLSVRDLRDEGRRRVPAGRGDERPVVGRVLALRRPAGGRPRPALEQRRQAHRGSRLARRGRRDPRPRARGVRRRGPPPSGPSSSPASPRSSTSGSRATTSSSSTRRSPPTATSPTSRCRGSGRPRSSPTSSTSAPRPAPACAVRRRSSASTPPR